MTDKRAEIKVGGWWQKHLKELRKKHRVTIRQLAQATGYQIAFIAGIEHGRYSPLPDEARKIEAAIINPVDIMSMSPEQIIELKQRIQNRYVHAYRGCDKCGINIYYMSTATKYRGLCEDCFAEKD